MPSVVSKTDLLLLEQARGQFIYQNDYGAADLEKVMDKVFGSDRNNRDAEEWMM